MTSKPTLVSAADVARRWLEVLQTESPITFGCLTVVPIRAPASVDPPWLLLDEALAAGSVEVSEISAKGEVPALRVTNRGTLDVLLLDAEELVGAKQNRALNTTVLVRAGSTAEIPVSCVERGRWSVSSAHVSSSGNSLYASTRRSKAAQVHDSLRARQGHESDQFKIWDDLATRAARLRVKGTAMAGAFSAYAPDLREYTLALAAQTDQLGALVYGGGAWWGMDTLATARLFAKAWPRILSGYVMDALWRRPGGRAGATGEQPLQLMLDATVDVFPGVGVGEDCRFRGPHIVGAALVVDGTVAHSMAFPS